jgi:hypothetical protein
MMFCSYRRVMNCYELHQSSDLRPELLTETGRVDKVKANNNIVDRELPRYDCRLIPHHDVMKKADRTSNLTNFFVRRRLLDLDRAPSILSIKNCQISSFGLEIMTISLSSCQRLHVHSIAKLHIITNSVKLDLYFYFHKHIPLRAIPFASME